MSTLNADRPNRLPWPPNPLPFNLGRSLCARADNAIGDSGKLYWQGIGAAVAAVGVMISVAGFLRFKTENTPVDPTARAAALVTGGIYRFMRNPMYLVFAYSIWAWASHYLWPWLVILTPIMGYGLQELAIKREEKHLEARFGETWRAYRLNVARWL